MTAQTKLLMLLAVLLAAVGLDDWRRSRAPAPPALVATATTQSAAQLAAAPTTSTREAEHVVTELRCADGTSITQTDTRHETESAAAPVSASTQSAATATAAADATSAYDAYRYSLRVDTNPRATHDVGVSLGMRLGNLPLQGVVGIQMQSGIPTARLGLQLDI